MTSLCIFGLRAVSEPYGEVDGDLFANSPGHGASLNALKASLISLPCLLAALICGCGGGSQSNTAPVPSHPKAASGRAMRGASANERDAISPEVRARDRHLASGACAALSPAMAAAFDPRLREQARGGSLDICSYSTAPEVPPPLQLILELIPPRTNHRNRSRRRSAKR